MKVRLTRLTRISPGEDFVVHGDTPDPPEAGKVFSVLVMDANRLIIVEGISVVGFDWFWTEIGDCYSWAREVGVS